MYLKHLSLQNFRSYTKSQFDFNEGITVIVGPNTSGKTNVLEAISYLTTGDSFKTEKDTDTIKFGQEVARISGKILPINTNTTNKDNTETDLEFVVAQTTKKYLVNGVSKRRADFAGNITSVIFAPSDLDIVVGSPSLRRRVLDEALFQTDRNYRVASALYIKALRQRNAMLEQIRDVGANRSRLEYWDTLVIDHGGYITKKREEVIAYVNAAQKDVFDFSMHYDKSIISQERLLQYKDAEVGAGVTLVGPHRDDFSMRMNNEITRLRSSEKNFGEARDVKLFGSRGQQRLVILQLKLLIISLIEKANKIRPILLLDDIFSELDDSHIDLVSEMIGKQQTILTTTHQEFIGKSLKKDAVVIELKIQSV